MKFTMMDPWLEVQMSEDEREYNKKQMDASPGEEPEPCSICSGIGCHDARCPRSITHAQENADLRRQLQELVDLNNKLAKMNVSMQQRAETAEKHVSQLEEALRRIDEEDAENCGCEHDTPDCCNLIGSFCSHCVAGAALRGGDNAIIAKKGETE